MAPFLEITTSNAPAVDPDQIVQLETVLSKWGFIPSHGELTVNVTNGPAPNSGAPPVLQLFGEAGFEPYPKARVDDPEDSYEVIDREGFLRAVAPFLEEHLIIQTIGHANTRYPVMGRVAVANHKTGAGATATFDDLIETVFLETDIAPELATLETAVEEATGTEQNQSESESESE